MAYVYQKVKQILADRNVKFEEYKHEAVYTSEQAAEVRGLGSAKQGAKAMIFKTDVGKFVLVINPGDKKVDTKNIAKMENTKHLSLAKPEEVENIAGVPIGCVPPFGLKMNLKTYLNEELLKNRHVYFNPGSHTKTVRIRAKDLLCILQTSIRFA